MLRLSLLLIFLTHRIRTAYVTDPASFAHRLDRLYEKLERFTVAPKETKLGELNAKLERLNSLTPDRLTDEDEELLSAFQMMDLSDEQMSNVILGLQRIKDEVKSERLTDVEYGDGDWNDEDDSDPEEDYANDVGEEWDPIDDDISSTSKPVLVTPSAITKLDRVKIMEAMQATIDALAATNERPRILEDPPSTKEGRVALRNAAVANMRTVRHAAKCLTPQPRWLTVRKLAPAAGTVYAPPCVQLHRCAPDSGCCYSETDVCAPVDGRYVAIPFFLSNVNMNLTVARMVFYNHTRCACVSRESLAAARARDQSGAARDLRDSRDSRDSRDQRDQIDQRDAWRAPTAEPVLEKDEAQTAPPQMRRCTCPRLFRNRVSDGVCSCVCEWADEDRRRDCLSFARGKEHFGLRDRVCIDEGSCTHPACEHGAYDRKAGKCPSRRYKRRYARRFHPEKTVVV
ncbi:uncharacterized protein [Epargyreus clarus]|uniref:uncharacterized protein n=1 Tax=Epargyreus clarus TaxID=520877 RepID=UPI003C2D1550